MKKENKLATSQDKSLTNTRTYDNESLKASLILCYDKLYIVESKDKLDNLVSYIRSGYPDTPTVDITSAIKNGAKGMYGRTYRFSFQEVSIWIMEYKKNNNNSHLFQG
jgi:hypothetical protein